MNIRPVLAYFIVACIILSLLGQMHWLIGLILVVFGVWCLIIADQDADASHKRASHERKS